MREFFFGVWSLLVCVILGLFGCVVFCFFLMFFIDWLMVGLFVMLLMLWVFCLFVLIELEIGVCFLIVLVVSGLVVWCFFVGEILEWVLDVGSGVRKLVMIFLCFLLLMLFKVMMRFWIMLCWGLGICLSRVFVWFWLSELISIVIFCNWWFLLIIDCFL